MIHTTLSSAGSYLGMTSCQRTVRSMRCRVWVHLPPSAKIVQVAKACVTSSHRTSYPRCKTKNTRKIAVHQSRIWHDRGKDAWVMLQMTQLMNIQWTRPSFLPAGATFLGCARAVVQPSCNMHILLPPCWTFFGKVRLVLVCCWVVCIWQPQDHAQESSSPSYPCFWWVFCSEDGRIWYLHWGYAWAV